MKVSCVKFGGCTGKSTTFYQQSDLFRSLISQIHLSQTKACPKVMEPEFAEREEEEKPVRLSLHLIVKRHLPPAAQKWDQERIVQALNKITHLRLDRERIREIDSLELLGDNVKNIYLQSNIIERIENLECLKNLTFIALANNRIKQVENLTPLTKLLFLDLSDNVISKVDADEIPQSVIILNFNGNPCTSYPDYRGNIVHDLPHLKQLDLLDVTKEEKRKARLTVSSDEEEGEEEEDSDEDREASGGNGHGKAENFQTTATKMMVRSQKRAEDALKLHKKRTAELDDLRISCNVTQSSRSTARSSINS